MSINSGTEVTTLLGSAIPVTVELAVLATLIGAPLGVALGVLAAGRPGAVRDLGVQSAGLLGLALPEFVLASVLVAVLGAVFQYFPSAGTFVPLTRSVGGNLSQLIYPALVLAVGLAATVMRTTRSAYLDVARSDFVRTAHGKGLSPGRVRGRHVLRNSSVPIVTMVGIQFGYLLGGTVVVEQVFALPGLGRLLLGAILQRDYAVVQSAVLLIAVAFVLVNLVVDLVYRVLDPRTAPSSTLGLARRIWADRNGRVGLIVTGVIVLGGLLGLLGLLPYDPVGQDVAARLRGPSASHVFGTDQFGRDVFSRALSGIFASLRVAVVSVAAAAALGTLIGVLSGYAGGWADAIAGRVTDVLFAFPAILLALTVISALGRGWANTTLAIAIVYLPIFIRTARGPTLTVRNAEYVNAGRVLGYGPARLVARHVLPNVSAPILVQTTLALSWAVLTESTLSFLGLGTQPPQSSLGLMVADGRTYLTTEPWLLIAPSAVVVVAVIGLNLLGDGLRAALDPSESRP